jgi:hypothetical protein
MKKLTLLLMIALCSSAARSQCEQSMLAAEKAMGENFIADPQYVQAMLTNTDSLQFESVWLADNTYRIASSGSEKQRVAISLFDQNNNPIFNNAEFNYPADWDFFVEQSMKIRCVVRPIVATNETICVTVLTGFKK